MDRDLRGYARIIWKRRWFALAGFVLVVAAAVGYTMSETPVYQATASLFVGQRQVAMQDAGQGLTLADLSQRLVKSYAEVLTSRQIAERAVADSSLGISSGEVQGGLSVQPIVDTLVLNLTYRSTDPAMAERVANAVASAFVHQIREIDTSQTGKGGPAVSVSIIDPAVRPDAPVSPNPKRNVVLGVLLGLMLGVGLALGRDYLDVSVKNREDVERLGLPVVGQVPKLRSGDAEIYLERDPQDIGGEAFRKLRTSIGFLGVERPIKLLLVTSPIASEGKTTCALNLAVAYADAGFRTLLVEADLRRPSLHRVFGLSGTDGLTTVIIGDTLPNRAIRNGEVPNLQCMIAGAIPPNPVELLESEQMGELLQRVRTHFDMVVVDSPPIIPVADSVALAARCDGVIVVARAGSTHRDRLVNAVRQVEMSGGRFLGVLINDIRPSDSPYEYEYYYAYRAGSPDGAGTAVRQ